MHLKCYKNKRRSFGLTLRSLETDSRCIRGLLICLAAVTAFVTGCIGDSLTPVKVKNEYASDVNIYRDTVHFETVRSGQSLDLQIASYSQKQLIINTKGSTKVLCVMPLSGANNNMMIQGFVIGSDGSCRGY